MGLIYLHWDTATGTLVAESVEYRVSVRNIQSSNPSQIQKMFYRIGT